MNKKIVFTKKLKLFILVLLYNSNLILTNRHHNQDISLWIDEKQISQFSGFRRSVFAIIEGDVLPYVLDPNFEKYLPIIPAEVHSVNFTWRSGFDKVYYYDFDRLISFDKQILLDPVINIERAGKIPLHGSQFEVKLLCLKNITGVGSLEIGLSIRNEQNKLLPGTPLRLHLKKYCAQKEPDKNCYLNCVNGICNQDNICTCKKGYLGKYCENALCYPQCLNGGVCIKPGFCSCPNGFQGPHCEGGICTERCQNGGRCMQKDTCECTRGYFGPRCSFSKCLIPCLNNGRCVGVNKCKCRKGYYGSQCEVVDEVILARSKLKRRERIKMDCNNNDGSNLAYQVPHNGMNPISNGIATMNNSVNSLGQNPNHNMFYDKKQYEIDTSNNSVYSNGHSLTPPINNVPTNLPTNGTQYGHISSSNNTSPQNRVNQYPDYVPNSYNNNSNYYNYDRNSQYNQIQQNQIKQEQSSQQMNFPVQIENNVTNGTNQVYNSIQTNGVHHHPQTNLQQPIPSQPQQQNPRPQQHYQTNFSAHISSNNIYNNSNNSSPNNNYPANYDQNYYNYNNQQWRYQQPPPQQIVNSNQPQWNIMHQNPQARNLMNQSVQQINQPHPNANQNQQMHNSSLPSQPYSNIHPNSINQPQNLPTSQNIHQPNLMPVKNNYVYPTNQPVDSSINHLHHQNYLQSPPPSNPHNISQSHHSIPMQMQHHPYNHVQSNHHLINQQISSSTNPRHLPVQHRHQTPSPGSSIENQFNHVTERANTKTTIKRRRGKGKATRDKPKKEPKTRSAYALFFKKKQAEIKSMTPNIEFGNISKLVSKEWEILPDEEKKEYKLISENKKKIRLEELAKEKVSLALEFNENVTIKQEE